MIRKLPNFLIVGGQKCGTTWAHRTLSIHPEIFMSKPKELFYFSDQDKLEKSFDKYLQYFDVDDNVKIVGESSTSYLWTKNPKSEFKTIIKNENTPKTIFNYLGKNIKILICIRNPVARAISAYYHHYRQGRVNPNKSIQEYFNSFGIVEFGFFDRHIGNYKKVFGDSNVKVVFMDDIKNKPNQVEKSLQNFLQVSHRQLLKVKKQENQGFKLKIEGDKIIPSLNESNPEKIKIKIGNVLPTVSKEDINRLFSIYNEDLRQLERMFPNKVSNWLKNKSLEDIITY